MDRIRAKPSSPIQAFATRFAKFTAAMRRGCVTAMRADGKSSKMYLGVGLAAWGDLAGSLPYLGGSALCHNHGVVPPLTA